MTAGLCLLFISGYVLPGSNHSEYIPQIQGTQDPSLFTKDYAVQAMSHVNVRTYYKWAIYSFSRLGFDLQTTFLFTYALALLGYAGAAYALGNAVARSPAAGALTAFLAVKAGSFTIGGNAFFRNSPFPMMYAVAFALWGVYHCYRRRFALGYFLFGVAAVFQFIGGAMAALLLAPALAYSVVREKRFLDGVLALGSFVLLAALVFVPMLQDSTTSALTGKAFIELYGVIRAPHHIIPSTWPMTEYVSFAFFIVLAMLCLAVSRRISPWHKGVTISAICASIFSILIGGYVLVELVPIAAFAKLQFGRSTEILQMMLLPVISCVALELSSSSQSWLAVPLLIAPFSPGGPLVAGLILAAVRWRGGIEAPSERAMPGRFALCVIASMAIFAVASARPRTDDLARNVIAYAGGVTAVFAPAFLFHLVRDRVARCVMSVGVALVAVAVFVVGAAHALPGRVQSLFDQRITMWGTFGDAPEMAMRFSRSSNRDAVVLVPPSNHAFRMYSQRAVVVDWKNIPYTANGMIEWKQRIEDVFGVPLDTDTDTQLDTLFSRRSEQDLLQVAAKYGATHVLTRWHQFENAAVIDRDGPWTLYQLNPK